MFTTEQLIDLARTFPKYEKQEFLSMVWNEVFREWDQAATTEEATKRANEQQRKAEQVWFEYKG